MRGVNVGVLYRLDDQST